MIFEKSKPLIGKKALISQISIEDEPLIRAAQHLGLQLFAFKTPILDSSPENIPQIMRDIPTTSFPSRYETKENPYFWRYHLESKVKLMKAQLGINIDLRSSRFNEVKIWNLSALARCPWLRSFLCPKALHWDKEKYLQKLASAGVPTPMTYQIIKDQNPPILDLAKIAFPCICKPSFCSGGTGIFVAHSRHELELFFGPELHPENFDPIDIFYRSRNKNGLRYYLYHSGDLEGSYLIQQFISGPIYSISAGVIDGQIVSPFCYEIGVSSNAYCAEQSFRWPIDATIESQIQQLTQRIAKVLQYPDGPLMADFVGSDNGQLFAIDAAPRASSTGVLMSEMVFADERHGQELIASHFGFNLSHTDRRSSGRPIFWQRFPFPKGLVKKMNYSLPKDKYLIWKDLRLKVHDQTTELRTDRQVAQRGAMATTGQDLPSAEAHWNRLFNHIDWIIESP